MFAYRMAGGGAYAQHLHHPGFLFSINTYIYMKFLHMYICICTHIESERVEIQYKMEGKTHLGGMFAYRVASGGASAQHSHHPGFHFLH